MREYTSPGAVKVPPSDSPIAALLARADTHPQVAALAYRDGNRFVDITTEEFVSQVMELAAGLVALGIEPGSRIGVYSSTRYEFTYVQYAIWAAGCAAVTIYETSSAEQVKWTLGDSGSVGVFCENETLKAVFDEVAHDLPDCRHQFVIDAGGLDQLKAAATDESRKQAKERIKGIAQDDIALLIYTSGTTSQPKGVLHTSGGYLAYAAMTHEYVFDIHDGDVYWCTADVGWITGHSYVVYGPLANGGTTLMFEGVPNYPDTSRFWQVCDKHQVNICYTAPTAIRSLMRHGDEPVKCTSRKSLRILGSVGEPINPEAWKWYYEVIGEERAPIVDTWWQTETGGIMITPLPGATDLKPGSATRPFFGVKPALLDNDGKLLSGEAAGNLVITDSWPGQMRSIYGDHDRFYTTYFSAFKNVYTTGDGAKRDEDGYYWITGRTDDVLNVSGHRMGTAEVESALVAHKAVAEAAVVGYPHDIKGQGIYAYVTLVDGFSESEALRDELVKWVRKEIGPIATPDKLQWAPGLPKTRSGKIMRRILRKIAANEHEHLGDTSTLAEPEVVTNLIANRLNK